MGGLASAFGGALGEAEGATGFAGGGANGPSTIEDVFGNPTSIRGMGPDELKQSIGGVPRGWTEAPTTRGWGAGNGWKIVELPGNRSIRWKPGGGHHGPDPTWTVSGANYPTWSGPAGPWGGW